MAMVRLSRLNNDHSIPKVVCVLAGFLIMLMTYALVANHQSVYVESEQQTSPDLKRYVRELDILRDSLLQELKAYLFEDKNGRIGKIFEFLDCQAIDRSETKEHLGRGVTKDVYHVVYDGRSLAAKVVTDKSEDIKACWSRRKYPSMSDCYVHANYKLLKEAALAMQLDHPNIIKNVGMCVRTNALCSRGITVAYELGDRISNSALKRLPWDKRLQMSVDIADLLDYLEHSPVESLAVWDFKTRQFTIVRERLKLVDLDDLSSDELSCVKDGDCNVEVDTQNGRGNISHGNAGLVPCVNSTCRGLNAKFNMISAMRGFLGEALLNLPPPFMQQEIDRMKELGRQGQITASQLRGNLQQIIYEFM